LRLQKISNCKPRRSARRDRIASLRALVRSEPHSKNMNRPLLLSALVAAVPAHAQVELDPVVITAERIRQTTFDAPAAITVVTRDAIDNGGFQVNLSEALNRVPGISVLNRQNYAQDLQLSIRGFGSRSTFGIRGVRLIVDGIPATMPDGQGQASTIALGSAQRIEVLRGPLAQLYGNAAGGVVQVFTGTDATVPTITATAGAGPYGQTKFGLKFGQNSERDSVVLDASRYATNGYREHSAAERTHHQPGGQLLRPATRAGSDRTDPRGLGDRPEAGRGAGEDAGCAQGGEPAADRQRLRTPPRAGHDALDTHLLRHA
jgi:iron complex outermembrane receptor protein